MNVAPFATTVNSRLTTFLGAKVNVAVTGKITTLMLKPYSTLKCDNDT